MNGYKSEDLAFPFDRIAAPDFAIEVAWTIQQLISFYQTWSAYKLMQGTPAGDDINALFDEAATKFKGDQFTLTMPICVAAGHITP